MLYSLEMKFIVANEREMTISHIYTVHVCMNANTPKMMPHSVGFFSISLSFMLTNVHFFCSLALLLSIDVAISYVVVVVYHDEKMCVVICAFFCFPNIIHFNLMLSLLLFNALFYE